MQQTKAAIKIFSQCCPFSTERVCAIQGTPAVVIETIKIVLQVILASPIKGPVKLYDPYHFDTYAASEYGGFVEQIAVNFRPGSQNGSLVTSPISRPRRGQMGSRASSWHEPPPPLPPDTWSRGMGSYQELRGMHSNRWISTGTSSLLLIMLLAL